MTLLNLLRIVLCIASITLVAHESPWWWIAVAPWLTICIFGIILTVPVIIIIGMGAGAAQADWMSDEFIYTLIFVTPTTLALFWHSFFMPRLRRYFSDETPAPDDPTPDPYGHTP